MMGLISKIDAAIRLGVGIELIDYFTKKCPKSGENVTLKGVNTDLGMMYDEDDLIKFNHYLNQPWPLPPGGARPAIPESIKNDIKMESHFACAICGHMDNGEVAHIISAHKSLNNSPDNLIFLCPNHHTKYDLGYTLNSNISSEEVGAAKLLKRKSRCRILKYEANATRSLYSLIKLLSSLESKLKEEGNDNMVSIYITETRKLIETIPELTEQSFDQAKNDNLTNKTEEKLSQIAPQLSKFAGSGALSKSDANLRSAVNSIVSCASEIVIDIDEKECPHCEGRGTTGLVGDFCKYCGGSCVVTEEEMKAYVPEDIDEEECPHCNGRGSTGLVGDICTFCKGSCVVTEEDLESYSPEDIDEEECPHCNGRGTTGLVSDLCNYCGGSCVVTEEKRKAYAPEDIDEEGCPHCEGRGTTGLVGDFCNYCGGSCVVTEEKRKAYTPEDIDEEGCPHCEGRGTTGLVGDFCNYCGGSCVVTEEKRNAYAPEDIDEEECPHCNGRGTTGLVGDICALCKGSCVVTAAKIGAYIDKYGRR